MELLSSRLDDILTSLKHQSILAAYITCTSIALSASSAGHAESDTFRSQAMSGWVVKITKAGDFTSPKLYAIAESDPRRALFLANQAANGSPPEDRVETTGELSSAEIQHLGLAPEEVRDVTDNPPSR